MPAPPSQTRSPHPKELEKWNDNREPLSIEGGSLLFKCHSLGRGVNQRLTERGFNQQSTFCNQCLFYHTSCNLSPLFIQKDTPTGMTAIIPIGVFLWSFVYHSPRIGAAHCAISYKKAVPPLPMVLFLTFRNISSTTRRTLFRGAPRLLPFHGRCHGWRPG